MEEKKNELISVEDEQALKQYMEDLTHQAVTAVDIDETSEIINRFNGYLVKKAMIRTGKLDNLYDQIIEQMLERFKTRAGSLSNQDLINYLNTVEKALESNSTRISKIDEVPAALQLTKNTSININYIDNLSSEQKGNIADAIKAVLSSASTSESPTIIETTDYVDNTTNDNINGEELKDENSNS